MFFRNFAMMLTIKKYSMLLLYTLLSVGVWVHQHQCCHGNEAIMINGIAVEGETCCSSEKSCEEKGCCEGETEYFSVDDEHQQVNLDFSSFLLSRWVLDLDQSPVFIANIIHSAEVSTDQHRGPPLYRLNSCPLHYG
ncbi:MAG: hypothetical protein HRT74_06115 [Flavobacteriales bacterium]|nr:hypothetical protein [Flavobacteriales bacterium]